MPNYVDHFGQAAHHHADGTITDTFARMAGHDVGPAAKADATITADLGIDFNPNNGMG